MADYVTDTGAYVLLPQASFAEVLESAYAGAAAHPGRGLKAAGPCSRGKRRPPYDSPTRDRGEAWISHRVTPEGPEPPGDEPFPRFEPGAVAALGLAA